VRAGASKDSHTTVKFDWQQEKLTLRSHVGAYIGVGLQAGCGGKSNILAPEYELSKPVIAREKLIEDKMSRRRR
jgi:hypothetical protein